MPGLRTEIDEAPATRRDRIVGAVVWLAVTLAGLAFGALVAEAF